MELSRDDLRAKLQDLFGFGEFRPGQAEAIERALAGRDALVVMPTGAGKSVCYELPAAVLDRCVVVISPLIALMKDQVESLPEGLAPLSTTVNSSLEREVVAERLDAVAAGRIRLLYAAPERLRQWPFLHALRRAGVSLFVVDEAHCVSLWGHDFRPDYLFIRRALELVGGPPVMALTATATPAIVQEIGQQLDRRLELVRTGVLRPNLRLEVHHLGSRARKEQRLRDLCERFEGCGIVYVNSRARAQELAQMLSWCHVSADYYHAGLDAKERTARQDRFMANETRVMVATVAFGMGIDKSDVRFIIHFDPPLSLEGCVQEAGRAGRDGLPATCCVLVSRGDKASMRSWLDTERPGIEDVRAVYRGIRARARGDYARLAADELIAGMRESPGVAVDDIRLRVILGLLEHAGLIVRHLDLPRTVSVRCDHGSASADAELAAFVQGAGIAPGRWVTYDSMDLAARAAVSPVTLEDRLLEWQGGGLIAYRASVRDMLIELRPPPPDAVRRVPALLETLRSSQERRLNQLFDYLYTKDCHHARIARHFGVAPPARCTMCDHCAPRGWG
jgi:ATP-dependent DNA helicase RecQ